MIVRDRYGELVEIDHRGTAPGHLNEPFQSASRAAEATFPEEDPGYWEAAMINNSGGNAQPAQSTARGRA